MAASATQPASVGDLRSSLLDDLRFKDDQGTWEAVWSLNAISPTSPSTQIELPRTVVFGLLQDGLIELRKVVWSQRRGPPLTDDQIARLRHEELPRFDPENSSDQLVQISEPGA